MNNTDNKKTNRRRGLPRSAKPLLRAAAAVCGAAVFLTTRSIWIPAANAIMGQAASFSAALTMPRSTFVSLRERFEGDLLDEDGESSRPHPSTPQSVSPPSLVSSSESSESFDASGASSQVGPPSNSATVELPEPTDEPAPDIPKQYRAPLVTLTMGGEADNPAFLHYGNLWLRNYTKLTLDSIKQVLEGDCTLELDGSNEPQVLIYHTHTTESYEKYDNVVYDTRNSWRDTDNNNNMAVVGELLAQQLERQGIAVLHDDTQHDYPSYNGAYDRSRATVQQYLDKYPSIKVTIDLHRDGIVQADDTVLKPVVKVGGRRAAQLMIVAPCDDGSVGIPNWRENLRFAAELQQSIEDSVPGLCRPVFFCYRNYNLGLTDASLLFELGTNGNTLDEAMYTAQLIAEPIARVLQAHVTDGTAR